MIPSHTPHRRQNPLTGEWILVSPHRAQRPWHGQQESLEAPSRPSYDAHCYLCPGNTRVSGEINPVYKDTFVFTNDHSALLPTSQEAMSAPHELCQLEPAVGLARVLCFSPRHDVSLADMTHYELSKVIELWQAQLNELKSRFAWIQLFENKGEIMGCSMPHPHGQLWASTHLPNEVRKEDERQRAYFATHHSPLLMDYVTFELAAKERIVCENEDWLVVVPFWALWPFETLLLPKKPIKRLTDLTDAQNDSLATILKIVLCKYDNLFNTSFPYSMGWHGAPFNDDENTHWMLHAHFYPPLLRSATVKKFMVGYEMLAEAQRDLTAEQAAERLRNLPNEKPKNHTR